MGNISEGNSTRKVRNWDGMTEQSGVLQVNKYHGTKRKKTMAARTLSVSPPFLLYLSFPTMSSLKLPSTSLLVLAVLAEIAFILVQADDGQYTLNIFVDPSAVENIGSQNLNLVVSKGMKVKTKTHFNTAWITETPGTLISGTITYMWTPINRAGFVHKKQIGDTLRQQATTRSGDFSAGDAVTFTGRVWQVKRRVNPQTKISVNFEPDTIAMHPILLAPYQTRTGRKWATYFYGNSEMSDDVLTGTPIYDLMLRLEEGVEAESLLGEITGDELLLSYSTDFDKSVCIMCPEGKKKVTIIPGPCNN